MSPGPYQFLVSAHLSCFTTTWSSILWFHLPVILASIFSLEGLRKVSLHMQFHRCDILSAVFALELDCSGGSGCSGVGVSGTLLLFGRSTIGGCTVDLIRSLEKLSQRRKEWVIHFSSLV